MKHLKSKNPLIFVFVPICLLLFLTACSEEQFILSPEIDISQNANFSLAKVHNFKPSEVYPEDSDVFYEDGKTIVRPRKKMTVKEFMESCPYDLQFDSTATKNLSNSSINRLPPCNYRIYSYQSIDRFAPYPGKTISCFICDHGSLNNRINISVNMRNNYGFSQAIANYWDYSGFINTGGWNPSQIIAQLEYRYYEDSTHSISTVNLLKNSGIAGFYIDEPFDFDVDTHKCDIVNNNVIRNNQILYVRRLANLASPKPLFVSSYGVGGLWMYCGLLKPFYVDFSQYYEPVITSTNNTYIMCDKYDENIVIGLLPVELNLRERWGFFKNKWASKNNGNFMHIDYQNPDNYINTSTTIYTKWDALFPKAASLGLGLICLYCDGKHMYTDKKVNGFCNSAFRSYYLRGFAQTVSIHEKCDLPSCIGCEYIDNWYISEIVYHNNWSEVYP